jgi:hypothetical protein
VARAVAGGQGRVRADQLGEHPVRYEHNFNQHITDGDDVGDYDFGSIMHYPRTAFGVGGAETITPIVATTATIGQRTALSPGDIAAANSMCPAVTVKERIETVKELSPETLKERSPRLSRNSARRPSRSGFPRRRRNGSRRSARTCCRACPACSRASCARGAVRARYPHVGDTSDDVVARLAALEELVAALQSEHANSRKDSRPSARAAGPRGGTGGTGTAARPHVIVVISHPVTSTPPGWWTGCAPGAREVFVLDIADFPDTATLSVDFGEPATPRRR